MSSELDEVLATFAEWATKLDPDVLPPHYEAALWQIGELLPPSRTSGAVDAVVSAVEAAQARFRNLAWGLMP